VRNRVFILIDLGALMYKQGNSLALYPDAKRLLDTIQSAHNVERVEFTCQSRRLEKDPATTLLALNLLWDLKLSQNELLALGSQIGADVPIFIHGQASWAEGTGDQFFPIDLEERFYLLIKPDVTISTGVLFDKIDLTQTTPACTIRDSLPQACHNDFEAIARECYPPVGEALDLLANYGDARLTGTGACVFLTLPDRKAGEKVMWKKPRDWQAWIVKGINRSPAHDILDSYDKLANTK